MDHLYTTSTLLVPDDMKKAIVDVTVERAGILHPIEDDGLLDRHPEFAGEILRGLIKKDHTRMKHEEERRRVSQGYGWTEDAS